MLCRIFEVQIQTQETCATVDHLDHPAFPRQQHDLSALKDMDHIDRQ